MGKRSAKNRQERGVSYPRVRNWARSLRVRHINLFFAMVLALVGAVLIAIFAGWVLAPRLNVGTQETPPADLTRLALTIAAGVGGVVALVVAYRRQRDLEQGRFVEAFGAAAKQLGDSDVAVRLAGVYAMAGVADQTSKLKRQQCIDVLCGYLRLPYSPELGNNHQLALVLKKPPPEEGGPEQELQFQYRQNDKVVRQTIVRIIAAHLQEKAPSSWSSHDFDFTGAHLEEANFELAIFSGGTTSFSGVTFSGEIAWFEGAIFEAKTTWFDGATFTAGTTWFDEAVFRAETTSFDGATFSGDGTSFEGTTFDAETTSFDKATFSAAASFDRAIFSSGYTGFVGATFSVEGSFSRAIFSGGLTRFDGATFSGESASFDEAIFSGGLTSFDGATFSVESTYFFGATFSSAVTSFHGATFSGLETTFKRATFSGTETSFAKSIFSGGRVTFENPQAWSPAPVFDWDAGNDAATSKPENVEPQRWPPLTQWLSERSTRG